MNDRIWCSYLRELMRLCHEATGHRRGISPLDFIRSHFRDFTNSQAQFAESLSMLIYGLDRMPSLIAGQHLEKIAYRIDKAIRNHGDVGLSDIMGYQYIGAPRARMVSTSPNLQQIAKAVEPKQPTMTNDQTIANLEAQLASAVAKKEADEAAQQRADQLQGLIELAAGTTHLLGDVRSLETGSTTATARACFVKFRTELGALAQSLGYKLVRVGDRTTAQVVRL